MRRLALLVAGGALWLVLAALPAAADGGPHSVTLNSGSVGLSGDCAACHRAHTAQAAFLLKADVPALCENCHNGTSATTDVMHGVQYTPDGSGNASTPVLGALRGGGFSQAEIGSPSRLSYNGGGGTLVTFGAAPAASSSFVLTYPAVATSGNFPGFAGGAVSILWNNVAASQANLDSVFNTSTLYTGSTASGNMSGTNTSNAVISFDTVKNTASITFHNALRLGRMSVPTVGTNTTGTTATPSDSTTVRNVAHVGVTTAATTTSTHLGAGTVWGNGAIGTVGATGVVLECTNCHNPHGNGQYRILQTTPGSDWANGTVTTAGTIANWTAATTAVAVADVTPTTLPIGQVRNYTILPSTTGLTGAIVGSNTAGDYWRYKYDPSGQANWTDFYLKSDPMNSGYAGSGTPTNTSGAMTAWCITCHTRYSGLTVGGQPSSLQDNSGGDSTFMFKHGTTRIGCEQCHVSHGTNVTMTAQFSAAAKFPDGTAEDSALLKVNNRGTCQLCHEPTGTLNPGANTGTQPTNIATPAVP